MAGKQVILLTGEVQSGKTTSLLHWMSNCKDTAGILTPVEKGKRYFLAFPGAIRFEMEATADEPDILEVGRFCFSAINFERAISHLKELLHQGEWKYIIVDEIGPLELNKNAGFWPVIKEILLARLTSIPVLVVRKKCVDEAAALFKAAGFITTIITNEGLKEVLSSVSV